MKVTINQYAARDQKMGIISWSKSFLLRWQGDDGTTNGCLLCYSVFGSWYKRIVFCLWVSSFRYSMCFALRWIFGFLLKYIYDSWLARCLFKIILFFFFFVLFSLNIFICILQLSIFGCAYNTCNPGNRWIIIRICNVCLVSNQL